MIENNIVNHCRMVSKQMRKDIINMTYELGNVGAHLGGSLSVVEILAVLYNAIVKYPTEEQEREYRDRVILSKGHAALALYPALASAGIIERSELSSFKKNGSLLSGHPSLNGLPGIEFASGSLGQGLSLGVGVCLALKQKDNNLSHCYVVLGDGECDEGSVWEAASSAAHYKLNNLTAIVDRNMIQYDGATETIMNMNSLADKWASFGWDVVSVDGHDVEQLLAAFKKEKNGPKVIIAETIKGKGVSFMEADYRFHNARLSKEQYVTAMKELGETNDRD